MEAVMGFKRALSESPYGPILVPRTPVGDLPDPPIIQEEGEQRGWGQASLPDQI